MSTRVSDVVARATRTGGQGSVAYALDVLIASFVHLNSDQFGAIMILLTAAVSAAQNLAENRGWIPALLKDVSPVPSSDPVVDSVPAPTAVKHVTRPVKKTAAKKTSSGRGRPSG